MRHINELKSVLTEQQYSELVELIQEAVQEAYTEGYESGQFSVSMNNIGDE